MDNYNRHPNSFFSFLDHGSNWQRMSRTKVTPTLVFLLILAFLCFVSLMYMATEAIYEKSGSPLEVFLGVSFVIGIFVAGFLIYFIVYLFLLKSSSIYKINELRISETGIELGSRDSQKTFIEFKNIRKIKWHFPFRNIRIIGASIFNAFSFLSSYFEIELENEQILKIPLDIKNIDRAIETIAEKLEKEKVGIEYEKGKPSIAYIPGKTKPSFVNKPIGKWVLLVIIIIGGILGYQYWRALKEEVPPSATPGAGVLKDEAADLETFIYKSKLGLDIELPGILEGDLESELSLCKVSSVDGKVRYKGECEIFKFDARYRTTEPYEKMPIFKLVKVPNNIIEKIEKQDEIALQECKESGMEGCEYFAGFLRGEGLPYIDPLCDEEFCYELFYQHGFDAIYGRYGDKFNCVDLLVERIIKEVVKKTTE